MLHGPTAPRARPIGLRSKRLLICVACRGASLGMHWQSHHTAAVAPHLPAVKIVHHPAHHSAEIKQQKPCLDTGTPMFVPIHTNDLTDGLAHVQAKISHPWHMAARLTDHPPSSHSAPWRPAVDPLIKCGTTGPTLPVLRPRPSHSCHPASPNAPQGSSVEYYKYAPTGAVVYDWAVAGQYQRPADVHAPAASHGRIRYMRAQFQQPNLHPQSPLRASPTEPPARYILADA